MSSTALLVIIALVGACARAVSAEHCRYGPRGMTSGGYLTQQMNVPAGNFQVTFQDLCSLAVGPLSSAQGLAVRVCSAYPPALQVTDLLHARVSSSSGATVQGWVYCSNSVSGSLAGGPQSRAMPLSMAVPIGGAMPFGDVMPVNEAMPIGEMRSLSTSSGIAMPLGYEMSSMGAMPLGRMTLDE